VQGSRAAGTNVNTVVGSRMPTIMSTAEGNLARPRANVAAPKSGRTVDVMIDENVAAVQITSSVERGHGAIVSL
jgi:hypothetical protein